MLLPPFYPRMVVGYIRVSTRRQDIEDGALERQAEKIREFCTQHEIGCRQIHEDVATARRASSRDGLQDAVMAALRGGIPLMVTDLTRLNRHPEMDFASFFAKHKISVISLADGGFVTGDQIREAGIRGGAEADRSLAGTIKGHDRARTAGVKFGSPADNRVAAQASASVRSEQSFQITDRIVAVFEESDDHLNLCLRDLADLLNFRGIRTSRGMLWNKENLKRHARRARERIDERRRNDVFVPGELSPAELEDLAFELAKFESAAA